jgi:hypothetical protein
MSAVVAPRPNAPQTLRNLGAQLTSLWLPAVAWRLARCGRSGLIGLALLGASAVFLLSTLLPTLDEVRRLRVDLIDAKTHAAKTPPHGVSAPAREFGSLPVRTDIPQVLGVLLKQADAAQLRIDTAKYELSATRAGGLLRYQLSFPIDGPYPNVRRFLDSTLDALPMLAIDDLAIARKAIGDSAVEAQLRMTIFTRGAP